MIADRAYAARLFEALIPLGVQWHGLTTVLLADDDESDVQPTLGFQRVLQRAVFHVQSSGKKEVTGSNVLVAIFSEKQSQAVYLLGLQDIARLDVVNYISHGMPQVSGEPGEQGEAQLDPESEAEASPLEQYAVNLNQRAIEGKIDPLIGREVEVERTIQILCRRRKNNPLYVGEFEWDGVRYQGIHEPLVDHDLFDRVMKDEAILGAVIEAAVRGECVGAKVRKIRVAGQLTPHRQQGVEHIIEAQDAALARVAP